MKWHKMAVSRQLKISFGFMAFFILLIGVLGIWQSTQIFQAGEVMYIHPLQIRRAVSELKIETAIVSMSLRDMLLAENASEREMAYERLLTSESNASQSQDRIKALYLGSDQDVEELQVAYSIFKNYLGQVITMIQNGEESLARDDLQSYGEFEMHHAVLLEKIQIIDEFAKNKADELYDTAGDVLRKMVLISLISMAMLFACSYFLSKIVYQNIKGPLDELNQAFLEVRKGDMSVRSHVLAENELGQLSNGFNDMIGIIEKNNQLNKSSASLASIMMSEEEAKPFFIALLSGLLKQINGNLGAVYLLSNDQKNYELFTSIGLSDGLRRTFNAESFEGELGLAVANNQIQIIRNIDQSSHLVFSAASGNILPKEIMTIPLTHSDNRIAVITLASVEGFTPESVAFVDNILDMLIARTQGVLNYQVMKRLKDELQETIRELEMQKSELQIQEVELKEQNRELERQKEELREVSRLKTNFLSNMSHELRTPLNSVIALSGVLERRLKGRITDEEQSFLEVIGRSGKSLLEMINDILDISRIESGRVELEAEAFDLNDLIKDLVQVVKPLADEKNISILHEKNETAQTVTSDRQKIRHIIQNLLGNAIKFTEEGHVTIEATMNDGQFEIKVSDTGIGIAEKDKAHIFEEFRQADGSTTRKFGGTGLGLAITKKYTAFLGGNIEVESYLGAGSIFTVTLPNLPLFEKKLEDTEKKHPVSSHVTNEQSTCGKNLLIVEDSDPAIVQILDIFQEQDYTISVARDGVEAIQILEHMIPDGIILDLMMPKADGFEVLKTIRECQKTMHIPVLVLTAKHIDRDELIKLKQNHIHQLIQKGNVDPEMLIHAVASMLCPHRNASQTVERTKTIPSKRPTVLIVEDNPDNRLTVRALLKDDFDVLEANDGETAVDLAKAHRPDLILMDIALPGMDGVEAFRIIRKTPMLAHIPIIALTASAMTSDREIFLAHGFDAFIAKPIIENQFLHIIQRVLYGE